MSDRENCRVCGEKRPADAPSELCPACLLKAGLVAEDSSGMDELTILFGPASSSVLAAFGEEFGQIPPVLLRDADSASEPGPVIRPSSEEIPNPGQRSARLQLFGEIARGGMGAVLKGRDADLGRDLAVKILLESHRHKPEMVRRFIEEAQIAGQLQHPGIVPVYELGAFGDRRPYFAMKLVKGHTLAEILANRKSVTEGLPRLLSIFESICQTMAYAHARGVIHRDLKPSNVMVGSFGEVQVMDWGLAKVLSRGGAVDDASAGQTKDHGTVIATARSGSDSDMSQAGSIMGTPAYMAPEQARGEIDQVDERADVFALGSIFCELLTGQPAFTGRNSGEIQRKAARGELADAVTRLDQNTLGHDPELIALAKVCLSPERDDRPRHAGEVAERISQYHSRVQERLRQSEIERAAEKARAEEATKRVVVERQRLRLTIALAVSVLGFLVLGSGGWTYVVQERAARQAATERVVTEALDKANLLRGQAKAASIDDLSKWTEALVAANQARSSLEAGEPTADLRSRVVELVATLETEKSDASRRAAELVKDQRLFDRLDAIRFESVEKEELQTADSAYATAFRDFGIDVDQLAPAEAGRLLKQRANPQDFATRIDDWTLIRRAIWEIHGEPTSREKAQDSWKRLILIAQATDEDPWRNSLRSLIGQADHEAARRLSGNEEELAKQSARGLYLLAQVLGRTSESIEILKRAWRLSPNDYQICRKLGVESASEIDRVRFATAAAAARPDSPYARRSLGEAQLPSGATNNNRSWISMGSLDGQFMVSMTSPDGVTPTYRLPRFQIKTQEGLGVCVGPMSTFDPNSIAAESLNEAISDFRAAIRLAPENLSIHMGLANALVLQGRYDDALGESQLVARIDPKFRQSEHGLANAFYLKRQLDQAIELIRQEIERDPDGGGDYKFLGVMYHELGKKELAFAAYRMEFLRAGSAFQGRWEIELLKDTGTPEEVTAVLYEAIKARPDSIDLHEGLARFLDGQGKTEESNAELDRAIDLLRKQLRSEPEDQLYRALAKMFERHGKAEEAIVVYREAINAHSEFVEFYGDLANMLKRQGKTDESMAVYGKAIEAHPQNVEFHQSLARLLESQGKTVESDAQFGTIISLLLEQLRSNEDVKTRLRLGMAYLWRSQRPEAVAQFRRVIELDPQQSDACNDIAWELATDPNPKLRDGTIAVEFATKACELTEWKDPILLDTLAAACAESGDFEAAVKWQVKAIELLANKAEKEAHGTRLKLYQERKPYHSARPDD